MQGFLHTAVTAARRAGEIINQAQEHFQSVEISTKEANDYVTTVDIDAEKAIKGILQKAYPDHGFLAEESGASEQSDYCWIIDPLDGTTNFVHQFPHYCVSIALQHNNRLELGVIYDPVRNELFTAQRGKGARLNNYRLRVTPHARLEGALLGTGFPFRNPELVDTHLETLRRVLNTNSQVNGIRRAGAAALDLAYVAAGRLDGYWEFSLRPWDIAAGIILVKEAGGLVTDLDGGEDYFKTGNIAAANPKLLKVLLQTMK